MALALASDWRLWHTSQNSRRDVLKPLVLLTVHNVTCIIPYGRSKLAPWNLISRQAVFTTLGVESKPFG